MINDLNERFNGVQGIHTVLEGGEDTSLQIQNPGGFFSTWAYLLNASILE